MPRKTIRDLEAEIEKLVAENKALEAQLASLNGAEEEPAKPPRALESQGTRVFYPPQETTLVMPDDIELRRLMAIALAAYPGLGPKHELSFEQLRALRNHPQLAEQIVPDVAAINAAYFREFKYSFISIGSMKRMGEPDRRHYLNFHAEAARSWLKSHNLFADLTSGAFLVAALAHGDVPFTDGTVAGSTWELGLSVYVGAVARVAWKQVLAHGKLRSAAPVPANRRLPPASPVHVY
jgi:hypothetical protein